MTELPDAWRWAKLADVARLGSGGTPRARDPRYYGGDILWAVIGDLADGPISTTAATITEAGLRESSAKLVPPGAVLIAMYGSIGKLAVTRREMATNQAIAFAIPDPEMMDAWFLFYYLLSQRGALGRAGQGATQQNISQTILRPWPVPVPPLSDQHRIVASLESHLTRVDATMRMLETTQLRARSFRAGVIAAATTGRLATLHEGLGSAS